MEGEENTEINLAVTIVSIIINGQSFKVHYPCDVVFMAGRVIHLGGDDRELLSIKNINPVNNWK